MSISKFWAENGPWSPTAPGRPIGVMRAYRAQKRAEAEARQAIERTYTDPIKKERAQLDIEDQHTPLGGMTIHDFLEQVDEFRAQKGWLI